MASFTPAGSGGLPPSSVSVLSPANPTIYNLSLVTGGTEYSYALPSNTVRFIVRLRGSNSSLRLAYGAGQTGTTYFTIPQGCSYSEADISPTAGLSLYLRASDSSQVAEILSWA